MTANTVHHAIEELSRFNPDARISPPVEIEGISPATECNILADRSEVDGLEQKVEDLERLNKKLDDQIDAIKDAINDLPDETTVLDLVNKLRDIVE